MASAEPIPDTIGAHLSAGEQVLWVGQPLQGVKLLFTGANTKQTNWGRLFSRWGYIGWMGWIMFLRGSSWWSGLVWALILMALILISLVGSLVFDARRRANIYYALTNERVMIAGRSGPGSMRSISLQTLSDLSLIEDRNGRGTVSLGLATWLEATAERASAEIGYSGMGNNAPLPLRLHTIPDAQRVYQMIREAQKRVWEQHLMEPPSGQQESAEVMKVDHIPDAIRVELSAGEQVLWAGQPQPRQWLMLRRVGDIWLASPFFGLVVALLLGLVLVFFVLSGKAGLGLATAGGLLSLLVMLAFLLYIFVGRFFTDDVRTHYALISERVLIVRGYGRIQSVDLRTLSDLSVVEGGGGYGDVWLEPMPPSAGVTWFGRNTPPQLDLISDAQHVYQMIREAQKRVWEQHSMEPPGSRQKSAEVVEVDRIPDVLGADLSAGERVLWLGQPRQGLMLRAWDIWLIPFGLVLVLLFGWMCFDEVISAWRREAGFGFATACWPLILLAMLAFLLSVVRFFVKARQRAQIHYALTSECVLIARGRGCVLSVNLRTLPHLWLTERRNGYGDIWLADRAMSSGDVFGINMPFHLDTIPDAQRVYQMIRDAQKRA